MANIDLKVSLDSGAIISYSFQGSVNAAVVGEITNIVESVKTKYSQVYIFGTLHESNRVEGIKAIRSLSGIGLKEAKDISDQAQGLGQNGTIEKPERMLIPGCYTKDQANSVLDLLKGSFSVVEVL